MPRVLPCARVLPTMAGTAVDFCNASRAANDSAPSARHGGEARVAAGGTQTLPGVAAPSDYLGSRPHGRASSVWEGVGREVEAAKVRRGLMSLTSTRHFAP